MLPRSGGRLTPLIPRARADDPDKPLNLWQLALAGGWAGFVNSFIISPVELVKTRLQIQYNAPTSFFGRALNSLLFMFLLYYLIVQDRVGRRRKRCTRAPSV